MKGESLRLAFWHILHRNNNPCKNTRCAQTLSQLMPIILSSPATPLHSILKKKHNKGPQFLS
ncbi:hypothetical protein D0Y65_007779 [Glycine soja]|uniref:Uncharacterized protein n=1 Tax=Glycine soja TaxID=3848 RepID=A0A445LEV7_GLYSO|nr:hypothetical protein D0Y65_007779 [Glycine soja]